MLRFMSSHFHHPVPDSVVLEISPPPESSFCGRERLPPPSGPRLGRARLCTAPLGFSRAGLWRILARFEQVPVSLAACAGTRPTFHHAATCHWLGRKVPHLLRHASGTRSSRSRRGLYSGNLWSWPLRCIGVHLQGAGRGAWGCWSYFSRPPRLCA